jgi:hypothetical protein
MKHISIALAFHPLDWEIKNTMMCNNDYYRRVIVFGCFSLTCMSWSNKVAKIKVNL